jgi:hypothetical protein
MMRAGKITMGLVDALAALERWLNHSDVFNDGYRITICVPRAGDEARLRLALRNEFESITVGQLDLDIPLHIMGFRVEFKWPGPNA